MFLFSLVQDALRDSGCHMDSSSDVELARELAEATCTAAAGAAEGSKLLLPDGTAIEVRAPFAAVLGAYSFCCFADR